MKFNEEKWERLQRRKELMQEEYRRLSEEYLDAKSQSGKTEGMFIHDYDRQQKALPIINADKKLSVADLAARIQAIMDHWPELKDEYGLPDDGHVKSALLRVYAEILTVKKLCERREQLSDTSKAFGESWERLKEFAKHHTRVSDPSAYPVQDNQTGVL